MRRIALFPLPTVLLPGAIMPLHIFEPRYRRMVARCLEYDRRFGLVFHDPDRQGPFLFESGRVGCIAHIEQFELLDDGRSLILTRGLDRFAIVDGIESDEPFYEALVEDYEDTVPDDLDRLQGRRDLSIELFEAVVETLPTIPDGLPTLGRDDDVSFILASMIETDPTWLQDLLVMRDEAARMDLIDSVFQAAISGRPGDAE